jgi:hypothetical protein
MEKAGGGVGTFGPIAAPLQIGCVEKNRRKKNNSSLIPFTDSLPFNGL